MLATDNYAKRNTHISDNYNVAIYVRLSKEDTDKEVDESESIKNQKNMLIDICLEQGWNIYKIYCDEDFSGVDNERPEFNQLLKDAENKKFNLVLCKNQNRFTRDLEIVEKYIHNKFLQWGIRFKSVTDYADTLDRGNKKSRQINGLVNEWFLEDLSENIRRTFATKKKNGEFIGAFTPYGYIKDPNNKNRFIIDKEVSHNIKRIFDMYVSGTSMQEIARIFNAENIHCPIKYKTMNCNYKNVNARRYIWSGETIKRTLTNISYIGHMVQSRQIKISYKSSKCMKMPKNKWVIVEDTHEPIIDKETFEIVQTMLSKKSYGKSVSKTEHLLSGLLVCGDCNSKLTFRRNRKKEFITICSSASRFHDCTTHSIIEKEIEQLIAKDLKSISKKAIKHKDNFIQNFKEPNFEQENSNIEELINKKIKKINDIKKVKMSLYEDKVRGILSEEEFLEYSSKYNNDVEQLHNDISRMQEEADSLKEPKTNYDFYKILEKLVDFTILDKSILVQLVDKIEVFENKDIKVHYKFARP